MGQEWVVKLVSVVQPIRQNPRLELDGTKILAPSRHDPHSNVGEAERRRRQIRRGTLRHDNGLMHRGQLISRPDGSLKLRWQ
ncbi:MAG: hypothetical protein IPO00_09785 [Betaproteobacteria bacterium]|nr:hypothetical protein [Betaproteobacteria bacterium]